MPANTRDSKPVNDKRLSRLSPNTQPLWTVQEVAEYLQYKPDTVRRMAREGLIPCIKVGKSWRFRKSELETWFSRRNESEPSPVTVDTSTQS